MPLMLIRIAACYSSITLANLLYKLGFIVTRKTPKISVFVPIFKGV